MPKASEGFTPRVVDSLVDALVVIEDTGRIIYANPALGRLIGWQVEDLFGRPLTDFLPDRPGDQYFADFMLWMAADPPPRSPGPSRISLLHADGSELPVDVATFLVAPESGPRLVIAALWDVRLRIDIDEYQRVADDLMAFLAGASGTVEEVVSQLLGIVARSLKFEFATAWRWEGETEQLRCEYTWREDTSAFTALLETSSGMTVRAGEGLAGLVADSNEPRWFGELTASPHLTRHEAIVREGVQVAFIFPIRTKEHLVGVIELFDRTERRPDRALFDAVAEIGSRLGAFIERLELEAQRNDLLAQLERARAQQAFLLRANLALVRAGSFPEAVQRLAEVAVPTLGEICLIDVVGPNGKFERLAARHADAARQKLTDGLLAHPPDIAGSHPAALAVRSAEPQWSIEMSKGFLTDTTQDRNHFDLTQRLGFRSYVSVPLVAEHEPIGALTVVTTDDRRSFGEEELRLTQDLALQIASAVERVRSFDEQSTIARQLQESLLPEIPFEIRGVEIAVRYEAFGRGAQAGGDFYDVVPLGGNRVALAIGDVEGHDMTAATVMGQIRSAMRGYLLLDDDPGAVLGLLDGFLAQQPTERLATMVLAVLMVDSGEAVIASAGHPPPMVGNLQAAMPFPALLPGPPLGVGDAEYGSVMTTLAPLDVLCFYTDGLIELGRPGEASRTQTLAETVSSNTSASSDHIAATIMRALADREKPADDAALLVAKWRGSRGHA